MAAMKNGAQQMPGSAPAATTKRRWHARVERLGACFLKKAGDDQPSPRSADLCHSIESKRQTRGNLSRASSSAWTEQVASTHPVEGSNPSWRTTSADLAQ